MIDSVQGRMSLIFAGFLLLVLLSAAASFILIEAQKQDAHVINIAGRQRMLVQQMVRLALEFEADGNPEQQHALQKTAEDFEGSLWALGSGAPSRLAGAPEVELRGMVDNVRLVDRLVQPDLEPEISLQLQRIDEAWGEFKANLEVVTHSGRDDPDLPAAVAAMRAYSASLIGEADRLVYLYEEANTSKVESLRLVQILFLSGAILVIGLGGMWAQFSLLAPLKKLGRLAGGIGAGDLVTPIRVSGAKEIQLMSSVLEKMRSDLNRSRAELVEWASTLEQQVDERTQELEALISVSRDITSRLELPDVLQSVTDQACRLLNGEAAFLCLLDDGGGSLNLHAHSGDAEAIWKQSSPVCNAPAAHVMAGDRALYCGKNGCKDSCQVISPDYRSEHLVVPLKIGGQNSGALCVSSRMAGQITKDSCSQLDRLANVAAVALENARLYQQAERTAMLEERQRIAADMHDGLAQSISSIQMAVDLARIQVERGKVERALETLSRSRSATDQAITDVRKAIASLQEEHPVPITLQDLLAALAEEFSSRECPVYWEDCGRGPVILAHQQSEQISRVVRESLLNARSHSCASKIILKLEMDGENGSITILDDGQGFDGTRVQGDVSKNGHFGLKIMKARAARINGDLEISSSAGRGTCVKLTWPLTYSAVKGG